MIFTRGSKKITIAQGSTWDPHGPFKVGDYAIIIKSADETWPVNTIVKIEDMTGGINGHALIRQYRRSNLDTTLLPKKSLKKIWVINPSSDLNLEEYGKVPVDVVNIPKKLSEYDPELFEYLGNRIHEILKKNWGEESYEKHAHELIKKIGKDTYKPVLDPVIVIGNFLGKQDGTQGFVAKWGEQMGFIFVSKTTVFSYDEVIAHEYSHLLSFKSHNVAKKLNDETLRFGIEEYEMDQDEWMAVQKEKAKKASKLKDRDEIDKDTNEQYFFQLAEIFAHTEQVKRMLYKLKRDEIEEVKRKLELDQISPEQQDRQIQQIKDKPVDEYKDFIINTLILDSPKKFDIFGLNARKELYEQIFENTKKA